MERLKKHKKLRILILIALVVALMSVSVSAYTQSFSFHFVPPIVDSYRYSYTCQTDGQRTAYVDQAGTTAPTTYCLVMNSYPYTSNVTNFLVGVTSAAPQSFTYYAGYGGAGQYFRLGGLPTNLNFLEYYTSGTFHT